VAKRSVKAIVLIAVLLSIGTAVFAKIDLYAGAIMGASGYADDANSTIFAGPEVDLNINNSGGDGYAGAYISYKKLFYTPISYEPYNEAETITTGFIAGQERSWAWMAGGGYDSAAKKGTGLGGAVIETMEKFGYFSNGAGCVNAGISYTWVGEPATITPDGMVNINSDGAIYRGWIGMEFSFDGIVDNISAHFFGNDHKDAKDIEQQRPEKGQMDEKPDINKLLLRLTPRYTRYYKEKTAYMEPKFEMQDGKLYEITVKAETIAEDISLCKTEITCARGVTDCTEAEKSELMENIGLVPAGAGEIISIFPDGITSADYRRETRARKLFSGINIYTPAEVYNGKVKLYEYPTLQNVRFVNGVPQDGEYRDIAGKMNAPWHNLYLIVDGKIARIGEPGNCKVFRNEGVYAYKEIITDESGRVFYKGFKWVEEDAGYAWDGVTHKIEVK
jgi:hypothetical protein